MLLILMSSIKWVNTFCLQGEKRRQVENERVHTLQLMLEKEQRFVESLRSELAKSNDTKKQEQLAGAERRVQTLQTQLLSLSSHYEQEVSHSPPCRESKQLQCVSGP